jgi:hypothetical protein
MKISAIRSSLVLLPADEPLAGAVESPGGTRPIVTVEVETDAGRCGGRSTSSACCWSARIRCGSRWPP